MAPAVAPDGHHYNEHCGAWQRLSVVACPRRRYLCQASILIPVAGRMPTNTEESVIKSSPVTFWPDSCPAALCALLLPFSAVAHDFWLQAEPLVAAPREPIEISVRVGDHLSGKSIPNALNRYTRFSYTRNAGLADVPGERGRDPAGIIASVPAGTLVVGYQSTRQRVEFDRGHFTRYLLEEGITPPELPADADPVVEHYTRFAKTLVLSGADDGPDRSAVDFGFRLELHPLQNPFRAASGDRLRFRVTYTGEPAAGLTVKAYCALRPTEQIRQLSDSDGMVEFKPDCPGLWLLNTIKMIPATTTDADVESFWASLTFPWQPDE